STVTFQLQVTVPGHAGQGSMKERVGIVPETWHTWVLNSGQAAAWSRSSIHGKNPQPATRHVRLQDQRVVSRSKNDSVILIGHRIRLRAPPGAGEYRTPVRGLYLCGGSTHPGGNITGLCGYNAARVLAADLRLPVWWKPPQLNLESL